MTDHALEQTREPFQALATQAGLIGADVTILATPLSPEEAIGTPGRRDFPILVGRERVIEARVGDGRGHAFTDTAREFVGPLAEVITIGFSGNGNRAIYVAALNATLRHLGRVAGTVHCRDDDPERCGDEIARTLAPRLGAHGVVGLIGCNPAIAAHLVDQFGAGRVRIADLDPDTIGRQRSGVEVWDGSTRGGELIEQAEVVLYTGTTLVNGTFDGITERLRDLGKVGVVFGVTAAGVAELLGLERLCPCAR
jgi:hypothetical protein